ncbi:hypothetical protein EGR_07549 [Echinococcus granulosus]|uniref:Uncharacterized protein n=1 Tax=Echinococcus granulosus TaxID=6210 RepID=W6UHN9_ECHGR|nr:hypothetical protein EGR_07549 [Echinococcus granulosus]EUB57607.1 hypothetical protein EGR_07549 [Echinococcus granulosus]
MVWAVSLVVTYLRNASSNDVSCYRTEELRPNQ